MTHSHPAKSEQSCSTQLIDGDGSFNDSGIESFIKEVKLGECGLSYAVVSIMGPQSSGTYSHVFKLISIYSSKVTVDEGLCIMKCFRILNMTLVE